MGKTGSKGSGTGALNSDLTVKGTVGLRVVDASIFVCFSPHQLFLNVYLAYDIYIAVDSIGPYASTSIYCCRACDGPD